VHYPNLNVFLSILNNEDMLNVASNSIDRVIAPLSLHIVNNPDKMLSEVMRVLKPGGKFVFNVWGDRLEDNVFDLVENIMKRINMGSTSTSSVRSNWYLGDKAVVNTALNVAGF
jgi:ubiquinone/menaquinone biosynthesis C-methylase UbiE